MINNQAQSVVYFRFYDTITTIGSMKRLEKLWIAHMHHSKALRTRAA
jgi:hypothetical protein